MVTDNFYSSPALFHDLVERGIGACGTASKHRRGIPPAIISAPLRKDKVASFRDDGILSLKWKDKRDVLMIRTYHDACMVQTSRRSQAEEGGIEVIAKPHVVEGYNMNMGGVDKSKVSQIYTHICYKACLLTFR